MAVWTHLTVDKRRPKSWLCPVHHQNLLSIWIYWQTPQTMTHWRQLKHHIITRQCIPILRRWYKFNFMLMSLHSSQHLFYFLTVIFPNTPTTNWSSESASCNIYLIQHLFLSLCCLQRTLFDNPKIGFGVWQEALIHLIQVFNFLLFKQRYCSTIKSCV